MSINRPASRRVLQNVPGVLARRRSHFADLGVLNDVVVDLFVTAGRDGHGSDRPVLSVLERPLEVADPPRSIRASTKVDVRIRDDGIHVLQRVLTSRLGQERCSSAPLIVSAIDLVRLVLDERGGHLQGPRNQELHVRSVDHDGLACVRIGDRVEHQFSRFDVRVIDQAVRRLQIAEVAVRVACGVCRLGRRSVTPVGRRDAEYHVQATLFLADQH